MAQRELRQSDGQLGHTLVTDLVGSQVEGEKTSVQLEAVGDVAGADVSDLVVGEVEGEKKADAAGGNGQSRADGVGLDVGDAAEPERQVLEVAVLPEESGHGRAGQRVAVQHQRVQVFAQRQEGGEQRQGVGSQRRVPQVDSV